MSPWGLHSERSQAMEKKRILVVDDQESFTRAVKLYFERTGAYDVRTENDPRRALAAAQAFRPDLIVLDFTMPGMDGGQVAAAIRAEGSFQGTPILFLTGAVNRQDVSDWVDKISGPCLAKPASAEELIAWIEVHLPKK